MAGCHVFLIGGHARKNKSSHAGHRQSGGLHIPKCRTEADCDHRSKQASKVYHWSGNVRVGTRVSPASHTFVDDYTLLDSKIGRGMNGDILLAVSRHTTQRCSPIHVAVKKFAKQDTSEVAMAYALQEADIYLRMDHINITRLFRVYNEPDNLYMVMEYCSGGSLADRLLSHGRFSENEAVRTTRQMLAAINYCHKHSQGKICHRDVKHANFVYASAAEDAPLKLLDFGLSHVLSKKKPHMTKYAGTPHYLAPEVIKRRAYKESCDVWSLGVIVFSLLDGQLPFNGDSVMDVERAILMDEVIMQGSVWSGLSGLAKNFVAGLLEKKPAFRPTAAEALQHPWLSIDTSTSLQVSPEILQALVRFASQSHICRAAAATLVYSGCIPNSKDTVSLEAQFQLLDANADGSISVSELALALNRTLGTSLEDAQKIFQTLDLDGDAGIQYSEFLAAIVGNKVLGQPNAIEEAFKHFDLIGDGTIQLSELEAVLGRQFCGTSTAEIFEALDMNDDNSVDLQEFAAPMTHLKNTCTRKASFVRCAVVQSPLKTDPFLFAWPSGMGWRTVYSWL